MLKIKGLELYIGKKEEYRQALQSQMNIVCALNRASGYVTHQSVVGWEGRGCNTDNPYYLYKLEKNAIYLNMIDGDDPKYISDNMITPALNFIHDKINIGESVFIYCSLGESRSPSIALMYLLENKIIEINSNVINSFKNNFYPNYKPKQGVLLYIKNRWKI